MTEDDNEPKTEQAMIEECDEHLRMLERDGYIISKLCEDGEVRYFPTEKAHELRAKGKKLYVADGPYRPN